ncbi:hypothetical protein IWZ01DRAFT_488283 [Phyllosticta capitalensis]
MVFLFAIVVVPMLNDLSGLGQEMVSRESSSCCGGAASRFLFSARATCTFAGLGLGVGTRSKRTTRGKGAASRSRRLR